MGWDIDTLKDHFDSVLNERDLRYEQRFIDQNSALQKAEHTLNKRFDNVNEFRQTLSDQAGTFITRNEVNSRNKSSDDKIDNIEARMNRLEGRSGGLNSGWAYLVGAIGLAAAIIGIVLALNK